VVIACRRRHPPAASSRLSSFPTPLRGPAGRVEGLPGR